MPHHYAPSIALLFPYLHCSYDFGTMTLIFKDIQQLHAFLTTFYAVFLSAYFSMSGPEQRSSSRSHSSSTEAQLVPVPAVPPRDICRPVVRRHGRGRFSIRSLQSRRRLRQSQQQRDYIRQREFLKKRLYEDYLHAFCLRGNSSDHISTSWSTIPLVEIFECLLKTISPQKN